MVGAELEAELSTLTILVDTREQPTKAFKDRMSATECPYERMKLDFGDYSVKTNNFTLMNKVAIERKMNLDELAMCFGTQRKRFKAEFERAKLAGAKTYLLIENASMDTLLSEDSYKMRCRSQYSRKALLASLFAWSIRYDIRPIFCSDSHSGLLIKEILYREMKERLSNGE